MTDAHVSYDIVENYMISTVDMSILCPIAILGYKYETMVLDQDGEAYFCERTDTLEEAQEAHKRAIAFTNCK